MTKLWQTDLNGKVAVVTGGSGILGLQMARSLGECGAKVAILGRSIEKSRKAAAVLHAETGANVIGIEADVLDKAKLNQAAAQIRSELGACDILVNCAGGNHPKGTTSSEIFNAADMGADSAATSFFDLSDEGLRFVFDLNLMGTVFASQVFARDMLERGGSIINISSMSASTPLTKVMAYSAAKAAVESFTKWLAVHMAERGVRVNAIAPGFFLTEQNRALLTNADGSMSARGSKIIAHTPMRRYGNAEELSGALLFLADAKASGFVTGTIIAVDGGFGAYSGV